MSYCRMTAGDSDVYVCGTDEGLTCFCAPNGSPFVTDSRLVMIDHLVLHRQAGLRVPERAFERLRFEEEVGERKKRRRRVTRRRGRTGAGSKSR